MKEFNLSNVVSEEYRKKLEWATKEMPWGGAVATPSSKIDDAGHIPDIQR